MRTMSLSPHLLGLDLTLGRDPLRALPIWSLPDPGHRPDLQRRSAGETRVSPL